jgi:hypothetical protein
MTSERGPGVAMAFRELQRLRPDPWLLISMKTVHAMLDTEGLTDHEAISVFDRLADRTVKSSPLGLMRTLFRAVVADRPPAHADLTAIADQHTLDDAERAVVAQQVAEFNAKRRRGLS